MDEDGKIQLVTEDIRNGNGRAIKSKLWSPNRVDAVEGFATKKEGYDKLPDEALAALKKLVEQC